VPRVLDGRDDHRREPHLAGTSRYRYERQELLGPSITAVPSHFCGSRARARDRRTELEKFALEDGLGCRPPSAASSSRTGAVPSLSSSDLLNVCPSPRSTVNEVHLSEGLPIAAFRGTTKCG
jgi:hypothetical protein